MVVWHKPDNCIITCDLYIQKGKISESENLCSVYVFDFLSMKNGGTNKNKMDVGGFLWTDWLK